MVTRKTVTEWELRRANAGGGTPFFQTVVARFRDRATADRALIAALSGGQVVRLVPREVEADED